MCGIAGMVATEGADLRLVRRMCDALAHRGPDADGYHDGGTAALGARRLAIVDVPGGGQPVYSEDGSVVAVFNGEIYNFPALRRFLEARGHAFTSAGDTECLVHAYEEFGDDLVHRLRGMFAFAIWDARRARLLLARDRLGKKPLYWRPDGAALAFASELKSLLLDPAVSVEVDGVALHHYLTYKYVPAPWSILRDVRKLPPGHLLVWQDGEARTRRYWRLDSAPRLAGDEEEESERLRHLLLDATEARMRSERPVGAFLSGGLDSSAVVAAMARLSPVPVKTFTIGFDDDGFDERRYARMVAERYGTEHHEHVVTSSVTGILPALSWHFDEPFADASAIPSLYLARMTREHVTVALNGDGGDECLGGYRRYAAMRALRRVPVPPPARPGLARAGAALAGRSSPGSRTHDLGRVVELLGLPLSQRYARVMSCFTAAQKAALYSDDLRERLSGVHSEALVGEAFADSRAGTDIGRLIDADVNTYLPGDLLVKMDLATMSSSLEARSPFLDQRLMEWAAGLPLEMKIRSGWTKHLMRRAFAPWLPAEVVTRRKKGFGVPISAWLRTELRDLAFDVLTDNTARSRGLFRPSTVERLLRAHAAGQDHGDRIWALVQFELWLRTFADRSRAPSA